MTWKKLPPYAGTVHQGCLNGPRVTKIAPMDMSIAVGFGDARITKDGITIFDEMHADDFHILAEFEQMAQADPDHDWRCILDAPLRMQEYQRHGDGEWVLIKSGQGFA